METQVPLYDVIIVGGGPAGCSTALALNRADPPRSFAVVDDSDPIAFKIGESLPGIAIHTLRYLSPALSDRLFQGASRGDHIQCSGNSSAWGSSELYEQYSIMNLYGSGWHLDRALFDESFRDAVKDACDKSDDKSRFIRERLVSVGKQDGMWVVHTEHLGSGMKNCYRSKWVVDATGRKASLARKLGATLLKKDKLLAFYSLLVSSEEDSDRRTLIEATESGWWYTARLSHNRRIVVYHTDDDDPSAKYVRTPDGFLDLLHNDTQHVSSIISEHNYDFHPGSTFPRCTAAGSSVLNPICDETERWCAVGDSAMAFDPLSSQGMITAMKAGCFIGTELTKRITADSETLALRSISDYFQAIGEKYEKEKEYYYGQARFDGNFWAKRRL